MAEQSFIAVPMDGGVGEAYADDFRFGTKLKTLAPKEVAYQASTNTVYLVSDDVAPIVQLSSAQFSDLKLSSGEGANATYTATITEDTETITVVMEFEYTSAAPDTLVLGMTYPTALTLATVDVKGDGVLFVSKTHEAGKEEAISEAPLHKGDTGTFTATFKKSAAAENSPLVGYGYEQTKGTKTTTGTYNLTVQFAPPASIADIKYLQDFAKYSIADRKLIRDSMTLEKAYDLIDTRDNKTYTVARLKDDNIWMCDNLALVNYTCTPEDSDIAPGTTFKVPSSSTSNFQSDGQIGCYYSSTYGCYYTYDCAVAGQRPSGTGDAPYSISPAGWKLPNNDEAEDMVFEYVTVAGHEGLLALDQPVPGVVLGGRYGYDWQNKKMDFLSQGSLGQYWVSTYGSQYGGSPYYLLWRVESDNWSINDHALDPYEGYTMRSIVRLA